MEYRGLLWSPRLSILVYCAESDQKTLPVGVHNLK